MRKMWMLRVYGLSGFGVAAFMGLTAPTNAIDPQSIAGKFELGAVQEYKIQVSDRVSVLSKQVGRNESVGVSEFMPGAEVVVSNVSDEHNSEYDRSFIQHGYAYLTDQDGGTALMEFEGKGAEQIEGNKVTFVGEGTWKLKKGTGRYENSEGGGTMSFSGVPEKTLVAWKGTLTATSH
jgi:hypothetical protein